MSRPCHVLRVFTRGDRGGNHLGVINDVMGLDDRRMQEIAADLGFSETIYVDWTDPVGDPIVRIFTPEDELPFAGHPLVGAAWVMTALGPGGTGTLVTGVGPVTYEANGNDVRVDLAPAIKALDAGHVATLAEAAGLPPPMSVVCLGLPKEYCIVQYESRAHIEGLDPDMDALRATFGFLAYARDDDGVKSRFFAPGTGVPEDPATGSAAVALAEAFRLDGELAGSVTIEQGDEIGHPSTIELQWSEAATAIGGSVRRDEVRLIT